jgi:hypothetical protein
MGSLLVQIAPVIFFLAIRFHFYGPQLGAEYRSKFKVQDFRRFAAPKLGRCRLIAVCERAKLRGFTFELLNL